MSSIRDDYTSAAVDAALSVMVANNGPVADVPYPACLRPIAEAIVAAVAPLIEAEALRLAAQEWAENPDAVGDSPADARNWLRDRADYAVCMAPVEP